jgi:DHA1 family bicyclomycin/chloramphenicol resistance-like MFS transporter
MVQDYFSGADHSRIMAYIGMAMSMCAPIATVVGGQVHVHFGWRANFILIAILALVLSAITLMVLPPDQRSRTARAHWLREMWDAYASLMRIPAFIAYVAILSLSTATFYIYLAGAPSIFAHYGVGPARVGFFIMVVPMSYIAGSFLTSRLVRRFTDAELMLTGHCISLTGIGIMFTLALIGIGSPLAVALPLVLLGIGQGLLMPSTLAGTVGVVPSLAGAAAGAGGLAQQLCGAFGGYAIGLFEHDGALKLACLMLVFMLSAFSAQLWLRRIPH